MESGSPREEAAKTEAKRPKGLATRKTPVAAQTDSRWRAAKSDWRCCSQWWLQTVEHVVGPLEPTGEV